MYQKVENKKKMKKLASRLKPVNILHQKQTLRSPKTNTETDREQTVAEKYNKRTIKCVGICFYLASLVFLLVFLLFLHFLHFLHFLVFIVSFVGWSQAKNAFNMSCPSPHTRKAYTNIYILFMC